MRFPRVAGGFQRILPRLDVEAEELRPDVPGAQLASFLVGRGLRRSPVHAAGDPAVRTARLLTVPLESRGYWEARCWRAER